MKPGCIQLIQAIQVISISLIRNCRLIQFQFPERIAELLNLQQPVSVNVSIMNSRNQINLNQSAIHQTKLNKLDWMSSIWIWFNCLLELSWWLIWFVNCGIHFFLSFMDFPHFELQQQSFKHYGFHSISIFILHSDFNFTFFSVHSIVNYRSLIRSNFNLSFQFSLIYSLVSFTFLASFKQSFTSVSVDSLIGLLIPVLFWIWWIKLNVFSLNSIK